MPLRIFEPRYRTMLADCAERGHRFVILPPGEESEAPAAGAVGTIARIRAIQPLPEGRANVVVSGEQRVTLERLESASHPYLVGSVAPLDDVPDPQVPAPVDLQSLKGLAERYATALGTIADVERDPELSDDPSLMSFQVAALIEWDFPTKLRFLAVRSARERVARLLHSLPAMVVEVEGRAELHRRATRNGKGAHQL
jgi:Lon protease-like protein